jgi:hypothetical protein
MDWAHAIRRNREALERILAALFALVWFAEGEKGDAEYPATLPRNLHAYARRILRAAESAIRRLIIIAARDLTARQHSTGKDLSHDFGGIRKDKADAADIPATPRIPSFPLLDPLKRYSFDPPRRGPRSFPRICVPGFTEPAPIPVKPVLLPDDPVDATGLRRRLLSSRRALANLPREARRLARWQARNRLKRSQGVRTGRLTPLRIGRPPGGRKRTVHAVDDILKECHALAHDALSPPDTS